MKQKHYAFPKIKQYHQVLRNLKLQSQYVGKDENGDPVYDNLKELPVLKFKGQVKLHGTNAAIVFDLHSPDFYIQSRENIISEEKDNAGFAHWVHKEGHKLRNILPINSYKDDWNKLVVYGEWCGGNVQKGVALNELTKQFVVFGAKVVKDDVGVDEMGEDLPIGHEWVESHLLYGPDINVSHVQRAGDFEIEVDLNRPELAIEEMEKMVLEVEEECPYAKLYSVSGIGEGIVWREEGVLGFSNAFKTKGIKHSNSKVRKLPTVDVEKMNNIHDAVEKFCDEERLQQGWEKIVLTEEDKSPKNIGAFIKWLVSDIWEEEGDTIRESNIERKEMGAAISKVAARWFQEELKKSLLYEVR